MASIQTGIQLNDNFSNVLYGIINSVNIAVSSMAEMQQSMSADIDTNSIDAAREQLANATVAANELNQAMQNVGSSPIQTPSAPQPVQWQSDGLQVFDTSGVERWEQEVQSANQMLEQLNNTQSQIAQQASGMDILDQNATDDLTQLNNRIQSIRDRIQQMENDRVNIGADSANAELEQLRSNLNQAIGQQDELNQAMQNMDASGANAAYLRLSQTISRTERSIRDGFQQPVEIPVQWQTTDLDVFTGTGIERFQQEVASTDHMLNNLSNRQSEIASKAAGTDIFSDSALQDINYMGQRIQAVQSRIQQIESNPLNIGSDTANAELEQLRGQLNQALQAQDQLNRAVDNMDVSAANSAYNQLSQTIGNTERHIRDNVDEQGRFTQAVEQTQAQSTGLMGIIKRTVAAYATIQSIKGAIGVSDELTQTTARLDIMNDGAQTTNELLQMTYVAAQNARGAFGDMADVVARFGNNAGDAFGSSAEVVSFANLIQKQMTIAGASTQEASNAMLQLSQALGSGVLRGDELNSIFEQAPNLIQSIATYLDVPMGKIREMAQEGELTADVVKAAIFSSADDINSKFEAMPMTWGQMWTSFQNTAMMAFQPVLQDMNEIANSEGFQTFVTNAVNGLAMVASVVLDIFSVIGSVAGFVADNWGIIAPIIGAVVAAMAVYASYIGIVNALELVSNGIKIAMCIASYAHAAATGVEVSATAAATAAQYGFNTALLSCPLTWIILLIIALIAVVIAVANHFSGAGHVAQSTFGAICGGVNVVIQFFKNLGLTVADIALGIWGALNACASNLQTAFHNAICSVQSYWYDLLSTVLSVIDGICAELNKIPFIEFDYSGVTQAANDYAAKAAEASNNKKEYTNVGDAFTDGMLTFEVFSDGWVSDAYADGAKWGDGVSDKIKNAVSSKATELPDEDKYTSVLDNAANNAAQQTALNTGKTAENANKIAKSVDITSEDLKYMRDIAERDVVNRYTAAAINVKQTNHNNINNDMDLDGVTEHLRSTMQEQMAAAAEGVY